MPEYVLTENGNIKTKDGKPLVTDGEQEYAVDALGAQARINSLKAEAKEYRLKASERGALLKQFEGIDDPVAAIEAMQTVETMDDKHKANIDKLKASINKAWESKEEEWSNRTAELEARLFNATVTSKFATSEVLKKTILTPQVALKFFGDHFKLDGSAVDAAGNVIYSKENPGEPAEFDEAMTIILDNYPDKDTIMKGNGTGGSGGRDTGGSGGSENMSAMDKIQMGLKKRM